jgi:glycosyltransferase involved in cell wall biosynthesis
VDALQSVGVRAVLIFLSERVSHPMRFTHAGTGAPVAVLPTPRMHLKVRNAHLRFMPGSETAATAASYLATPLVAVARELRRDHCDVILCQEYEYTRFDLGVLLGRLLRLPVFATFQGGKQPTSLIERRLRPFSVRRCAGLIIGHAEAERVRRTYRIAPRMIAEIPNPVDVRAWQPGGHEAARAELGIPKDARVVEWHGHMEVARKGLDVLLDAWELICSRQSNADLLLLLVGTGRNTGALRRRVETNPTIRWVDRFVHDRRALKHHVAAADVYTLPSGHGGFAVAPLEAMACGLPVVATDVSGVRDLLPAGEADGGFVVPPDDPRALAGAVLSLLGDPELVRTLGARAQRRVEEHLSLQRVGPRLRRFLFPGRRLGLVPLLPPLEKRLHRLVDEPAHPTVCSRAPHADRSDHVHVLAAGELGVEERSDLEQRRVATQGPREPAGGLGGPPQVIRLKDLQQDRFPASSGR